MSGLKVEVFGRTDVGKTRDHNEDSFLVADLSRRIASLQPDVREHEVGPRGSLFIVADGMGGAAAGEVASDMAVDTIYTHMVNQWGNDQEIEEQRFAYRLKEAVEIANQQIHAFAKDHPEHRGMGTTTTAAGVFNGALYLTQIGDSRGYLIRNGVITQITKDQSLMQRLVDAGELTEEEAAVSDRRNIILQALGPDPQVKVDLTRQELRKGDILVMCSDGLSGQVPKEDILQVVMRNTDLVAVCKELIDLANERGGPDNITCIVARFSGDGLPEPDGSETVGHHVYPLLDTESTTQPVPVYRPEEDPSKASTQQVEVQKKPNPGGADRDKGEKGKKWWKF
ncbi:MAG TPA: Stp1/IreP family PP2C-type Ser/Thr phosphatase [Gemmatimonadales bacterium]|nr:Stp1/IreP family PP2C-type Ser/Thr phosphatase [Gemmatimonadales bacterium]